MLHVFTRNVCARRFYQAPPIQFGTVAVVVMRSSSRTVLHGGVGGSEMTGWLWGMVRPGVQDQPIGRWWAGVVRPTAGGRPVAPHGAQPRGVGEWWAAA